MTGAGDTLALPERILDHARRRPTAPALVWRGRTVDYAELAELALDASRYLGELAPGERRPVGILTRKSPSAIALILACMLARRAAFVPSPDLDSATLRRLFAQAGCSHVVSPGESFRDAAWEADVVPGSCPDARREAGLMLTTSGSTGPPKIVPLALDRLDRFAAWGGRAFAITHETAVLSYAPLNFDLCTLDIWTTLSHGGTVVLVGHDRATDARHLLDLLSAAHVHLVQGVPMLYRLLSDGARKYDRRVDSVRHVLVTGDSIAASALVGLTALFPNARFHNVYGCTETNDSFACEIDMGKVAAGGEIPIGEPLPGVSALIVATSGDLVDGPGEGELWVATPFQTVGYLDASLNDGKFGPHPKARDGQTYFRTGDIVRRHDDGAIALCGRTDSLVKVRGLRVSTQAVEQALLEHKAVVEVAVLAIPDALAGSRLHAVVRRAEESPLDSLVLRRHCVERLDRAAIPSTIDIVTRPLPKTPTGKVDRRRSVYDNSRRSAS